MRLRIRRTLQILLLIVCVFAGAGVLLRAALLILQLEATIANMPLSV